MINRSLIRIKTIQILYSYLLTRGDFRLEPAPDDKDTNAIRHFAYSVYLDYLVLLLRLSSVAIGEDGTRAPVDSVLIKNSVGAYLGGDPAVRATLAEHPDKIAKFDSLYPLLLEAIADTDIYKTYRRKRKFTITDDVDFWIEIFKTVIAKNKALENILKSDENYSRIGMDRALKMFETTLTSLDDKTAGLNDARKALNSSLSQAYSLYHALLMLPVYITDAQAASLENAKRKNLRSDKDLNPNTRLLDNLFVEQLRNCRPLVDYIDHHKEADVASWRDADTMLDSLLSTITRSELYANYMESPAGDFATDAAFWREVLRSIVFPSDELAEALERNSVYWNDDLAIMSTFVLKTIRRTYPSSDSPDDNENLGHVVLLPKFMNKEDEAFGLELFDYVVENRKKYRSYIDRFIDSRQWDTDRLAFMDIVLMMTAIAEMINYPSIPLPVTMNEYIEIANDYSTPRSGQFINGILFSVAQMLNNEGVINKL